MEETVNLKIVVCGLDGVGKQSLIQRFVADNFDTTSRDPSAPSDCLTKKVDIDGQSVQCVVWRKNEGESRFRSIGGHSLRNADLAFILVDVRKEDSLQTAPLFHRMVINEGPAGIKAVMVGTCIDDKFDRKVTKRSAEEMAGGMGIPYREVSSKDGIGVNDLFLDFMRLVLTDPVRQRLKRGAVQVNLRSNSAQPSCC